MKKNRKTKHGFSLLETIIAVALFSLASVMIAGSFASFLKNSIAAKKAQRNAESAQYAMSLMAKTIRNSVLQGVVNNAPTITIFDNSQGKCMIYSYDATDEVLKIADDVASDITKCNTTDTPALATFSNLTRAGEIMGVSFFGSPTIDPAYGKVTITLDIAGTGPVEARKIQTTISLRQ